ncbi:MAG: MFS transporter [Dehalococcoidia bacterium]|nr:MFS transporter [Dehalococcoidia bacterium]
MHTLLRPVRRVLGPLLASEQLLMISISTVLVMAGQGVVGPVLPLFADQFGVSTAVIGLTLSTFALARLILNVPLGVLSDRYGRRMLLISGPLVTAVGMIGSGFSQDIAQLLAWRFVAGAGSAMYMTGAQIYLADISTPGNRARYIGTNQAALLLGVSIGPGVGGLIAEVWGLRTPFYVVGAAALIATVYAYIRLPETRDRALAQAAEDAADRERDGAPEAPRGRVWLAMVTSRDFAAVSLVTMSIFFTRTAARQTLLPLLVAARFDFSAGAIGLLFTGMAFLNMVLIAPAAWIADRFGRKWAIVPSGFATAGGLLLVGYAPTVPLLLFGATVLAIGTSIAGPAPAAYAADIAPPHLRGLAMGLYRSSGDIGFMLGPPLLGALADATSYGWGMTANAVFVTTAAVIFLLAARETIVRVHVPAGSEQREEVPAG